MRRENGNAVLGALVNISVGSLLTLSMLGLVLASHQLLVMRSIASDAARFGALANKSAVETERYALRLLDEALPSLANYRVTIRSGARQNLVEITSNTPGIGFLATLIPANTRASASYERFS